MVWYNPILFSIYNVKKNIYPNTSRKNAVPENKEMNLKTCRDMPSLGLLPLRGPDNAARIAEPNKIQSSLGRTEGISKLRRNLMVIKRRGTRARTVTLNAQSVIVFVAFSTRARASLFAQSLANCLTNKLNTIAATIIQSAIHIAGFDVNSNLVKYSVKVFSAQSPHKPP